MRLTFMGAAGTVTGSKYLLEHGGRRLLVDCGLFQGPRHLRLRNLEPFPLDAASIDAVVLTHAHIDHSGYLPALARQGFRGAVHATRATCELCALVLPDSGRVQEEEAADADQHAGPPSMPMLPLYTQDDGRRVLARFQATPFGQVFEPVSGVRMCFHPAGHLLGAASVHVAWEGASVLFSGDLGRDEDVLMHPPAPPPAADNVLVESTYGDRLHARENAAVLLAQVVARTAGRGGVVVVPAFAVGRAQALLHLAAELKRTHHTPDVPVFLDSPMAAIATGIYRLHPGEHRLDAQQCQRMAEVARIVTSLEESRALQHRREPAIIIAASGMASGGRVVHHLKGFAPDGRNTILLAGYQAPGTVGAALLAGEREIDVQGTWVPVHAEVARLGSLSAHADRRELLAWLGRLPRTPRRVFVTHGEPPAAYRLRLAVQETHGWPCTVATPMQSVEL